ncbi:MAG: agmatinase, partial [Deltaproteobacteria bacterium CG11_big_fil_rev_8_21_14_0_20_49_13]
MRRDIRAMIYKGDIPEKFLKYDNAHFVIVPVPYEKTTSYGRGTCKGPGAICAASEQVELFDEELQKEVYQKGIATVKEVTDLDELQKVTEKILEDKKFPIVLGGEHTISAPPVRAFKKFYNDISVVHFDAHADLRDEYNGSKLSHACVMRRVVEEKVPLVQIGIRNHSLEEAEVIKKEGLNRPFYSHLIHGSDYWMEEAVALLSKNVYISFDVDAFDASIMPSTGTPEPGGMNWFQVVKFFRLLCKSRNVVGADFVELAPVKGNSGPDFTVAKLIYKL